MEAWPLINVLALLILTVFVGISEYFRWSGLESFWWRLGKKLLNIYMGWLLAALLIWSTW